MLSTVLVGLLIAGGSEAEEKTQYQTTWSYAAMYHPSGNVWKSSDPDVTGNIQMPQELKWDCYKGDVAKQNNGNVVSGISCTSGNAAVHFLAICKGTEEDISVAYGTLGDLKNIKVMVEISIVCHTQKVVKPLNITPASNLTIL